MISIITSTIRPERMDDVFENYARQLLKQKELIIVLHRDDMDLAHWERKAKQYPNVSVYQCSAAKTVGECKNFAVTKATYPFIAKFDDDDYYGPSYLTEVYAAFRKTGADLVGKARYYAYLEKSNTLALRYRKPEKAFVKQLGDPTLAFRKKIFKHVQWPSVKQGGDKLLQKDCLAKGYTFYSTSKNNFAYIRRIDQKHTWAIGDDEFIQKWCKFIKQTDDFRKKVNKNAKKDVIRLRAEVNHKVTAIIKTFERPHCVDTLIKSIREAYPKLRIIVADDSITPAIRKDVEYHVLPFDSGVSKGRNFLVKQVKTPYVLLLDDDFCFIPETKIEKLLHILEASDLDIVAGRYLEEKGVRNSQATLLLNEDGELLYNKASLGKAHGVELYDIVNNFFLARTSTLLKHKWDERLKAGGEHLDYFLRHQGKIKVAMHPKVFVYHYCDRSNERYNRYRSRGKSTFNDMFMKKNRILKVKREQGLFLPIKSVRKYVSPETIAQFNLK